MLNLKHNELTWYTSSWENLLKDFQISVVGPGEIKTVSEHSYAGENWRVY